MSALPDRTNFYCSIDTHQGPEELARVFASPVWRVRECSWAGYEARSDFAEVVIESSGPVLVHGPVADVVVNCWRIIELMTVVGLSGAFECYNESDELIFQKRFGSVLGHG